MTASITPMPTAAHAPRSHAGMSAVTTLHPAAASTRDVATAATTGSIPVRTSEPEPNAWITATGQITYTAQCTARHAR